MKKQVRKNSGFINEFSGSFFFKGIVLLKNIEIEYLLFLQNIAGKTENAVHNYLHTNYKGDTQENKLI